MKYEVRRKNMFWGSITFAQKLTTEPQKIIILMQARKEIQKVFTPIIQNLCIYSSRGHQFH